MHYKQRPDSNQTGKITSPSFSNNRERRNNSSDDLIIDDNTVYEIDPECYEKVKRARVNQKNDWNKK